MARLAPVFVRALQPESVAGPQVTKEELQAAIAAANPGELLVFAQQAVDTLADGELVKLLRAKLGPNQIPKPTNSLADDPASAAWLEGGHSITKADRSAINLQAIRMMQRALVKIGAQHPGGREVAKLLQLPYGADGGLGQTTLDGLNAALRLAGGQPAPNLTLASVIGKEVAQTLERLLAQTPRMIHPVLVDAPPAPDVRRTVVFVGMGDHAKHEADYVKRALPAGTEMAYVGDSALGDDVIKVQIGGRSHVLDLKTDEGRARFLDTAFQPPLGAAQKAEVKKALEANAWGLADARDEIAMLALEMHKVEASNGRRAMPFLYLSGHSAGGGVWGDHNGQFPMEALTALTGAFPKAAATVEAPFFAACNHLHPANVEELQALFPNMKHAGGYSAYAPGTWVGGIAQCLAWIRCLHKGAEVITPEMMHAELTVLKREAGQNRNNPLFYANEKRFHIATWNAADALYRWFEHNYADNSYTPRTREMRANQAEVAQRFAAVKALEPEFRSLLAGVHPHQELRDVEPHGQSVAKTFYEGAMSLSGTLGLSAEQSQYAKEMNALGLRARYYGNILERFTADDAFGPLIRAGNAQLAALGFATKGTAELKAKALKRKPLLDYVAAMGAAVQAAAGRPADQALRLHQELETRLVKLENIPAAWT